MREGGAAGAEPRLLRPSDSIAELTDLLHRAYASLAAAGLRAYASWQDEEATRRRAAAGECWVVEDLDAGRLVATVTLRPPGTVKGTPWYERTDVATLGQFAVAPELQGRGLGSALIGHLERRASQLRAAHLALDTPESAGRLRRFYEKRGFRLVEHVSWSVTNYRSVVLSKRVDPRESGR